ncbi:MAG: hypothetical protein PHI97_15530 [Desulfobulbus sp.]|nr:hypothetical protein [Desulfobulbus sp.]
MIGVTVQPFIRSDEASFNTLAGWGNDDLLLTEPARRTVAEASPRAFRVLDWAALREEFERHDRLASLAKKRINRHGVTGALLSVNGASLLAFGSLLPTKVLQSIVIAVGCGFVLVGGLMGLWHLLGHTGRAKWLTHRLWTERLRQFYFQYLVNEIDATIDAMGNDVKLEKYRSLRDGALRVFISDTDQNLSARSFAEGIRWIADDHDDAHAWGQSVWQVNRVLPGTSMTDDHRELLECLSRSRIGIQEIYAQLNLKEENSSQGNMASRVIMSGNIATFVYIVSLTLAGMWILLVSGQESIPSNILIALSGVAAAWGLYFRLVDQGMGYSLDAERYKLYAEQVKLIRQQFNAVGDDLYAKIAALRQLEIYVYREMRQFLRTHFRSRFLG